MQKKHTKSAQRLSILWGGEKKNQRRRRRRKRKYFFFRCFCWSVRLKLSVETKVLGAKTRMQRATADSWAVHVRGSLCVLPYARTGQQTNRIPTRTHSKRLFRDYSMHVSAAVCILSHRSGRRPALSSPKVAKKKQKKIKMKTKPIQMHAAGLALTELVRIL